MVCKKCGMELIEGIDICPYCGEDNHLTEKQQILNDLGSLKMDVPEAVESNIEEEKIDIDKDNDKDKDKDNDNDNNNFYKILTEVEEPQKESITIPNIDNYLNSDIIRNNKPSNNNINTEKELNEIIASIDEQVNKLKEVTEPISNDEKDDTLNIGNVIDIVNNSSEEKKDNNNEEQPIDINNIIGDIKNIDEKINNDIDNTLKLAEIKADNNEEKLAENINSIQLPQEENEEQNGNNNEYLNTENVEETNDTKTNDVPATLEEQHDEVEIPVVEEKTQMTEEPEINFPKNTESEVQSSEESGISTNEQQEEIETQKEIPNALNLENLIDDLKQVPVEDANKEEDLVSDMVEQKQDELNTIDEVKNTEPNEIKLETQNLEDLIKESETKKEENIEQPQVYINPILDNVEPPKVADIPTYLPPKQDLNFEMPEVKDETYEQTSNIEETNNMPNSTPILMPEDMNGNNVIIGKGIKTNEMLKDEAIEPKKSSNASVIILFILMIALGIGVAFAVSFIFNM